MGTQLVTERKKLIARELREHGICAEDRFQQFDSLVTACYRVMAELPHENRLPSTGIVLLSSPFDEYEFDLDRYGKLIRVEPQKEALCWAFADGINSFVVKDPEGVGLLVLNEPVIDELSLFTLRDDILFNDEVGPSDTPPRECLIIHRSEGRPSYRVTVLARESIVSISGLSYVSKPYQYDILQALRKEIIPFPWKEERIQTLKSALRLAVHKLSPENHGATFLILSQEDTSALDQLVTDGHLIIDRAINPTICSITKRIHQRPLAHLMGQMDGATTISPAGDVLNVGAFFGSIGLEKSRQETTRLHGARHRSAAAFTKLIEGMAIVVSSDGPLTVFRKGEPLNIPTTIAGIH